jgi:hypothetical protein
VKNEETDRSHRIFYVRSTTTTTTTTTTDDDDDADAAPHLTRGAARRLATFGDLPGDVLGLVLDRLHPHALARAACVSREWRARAECADRWRALALAAFGESRCAAAAAGKPENAGGTSNHANARKQKRGGGSPLSWRAAFEVARARWPAMAPRRHTRRAFCETCQTLAWFPGVRGFPSRARGRDVTPKGKGKGSAALVASCGCAAATFARRSENAKNENRLSNPNPKLRSRDAAVSAAAVALPVRGHAPARGALSAPGREAKGAKGAKGVRRELRVVRLERVVRLGLERGDGRFRVRRVLGRGLARREEAVANIVRLSIETETYAEEASFCHGRV